MNPTKNPILLYAICFVLLIMAVGNCVHQAGPSKEVAEQLNARWGEILMQIQAVTDDLSYGAEVVIIIVDREYAMSGEEGMKRVKNALKQRGITVRSLEKVINPHPPAASAAQKQIPISKVKGHVARWPRNA